MEIDKMKHFVGAFVFTFILVGLYYAVYSGPGGLVENYGVVKGDTKNMSIDGNIVEGNIIDQLISMNIIAGPQRVGLGLAKLNPQVSSNFDILGGLMSVGIGAIQSVFGLLTTPFEIVSIIVTYYAGNGLGLILGTLVELIYIYIGFIFVRKVLGGAE